MPERISIQGISGSGKTSLGRELGRRLGIPHLETDALVHGPNWAEASDAALRAHLVEFTAGERWVVDADYRRKVGTLVLERADTVVWLDLPLHVCLGRLWRRTSGRIHGITAALERQPRVVEDRAGRAGLAVRLCRAQALVEPARELPAAARKPRAAAALGGAAAIAGAGRFVAS